MILYIYVLLSLLLLLLLLLLIIIIVIIIIIDYYCYYYCLLLLLLLLLLFYLLLLLLLLYIYTHNPIPVLGFFVINSIDHHGWLLSGHQTLLAGKSHTSNGNSYGKSTINGDLSVKIICKLNRDDTLQGKQQCNHQNGSSWPVVKLAAGNTVKDAGKSTLFRGQSGMSLSLLT